MNLNLSIRNALVMCLVLTFMFAGCVAAVGGNNNQPNFPLIPTSTDLPCPYATPEALWVDPVTSPTDELSQVITVYIGNGVEVTVESESGVFTVTGDFNHYNDPAQVEITLLPDTVHHLEVKAGVKPGLPGPGDCKYGGYTLSTTNDRNGAPLVIVQGAATP